MKRAILSLFLILSAVFPSQGEDTPVPAGAATVEDGLSKAIAEIGRLGLEIERVSGSLESARGERDALLAVKTGLESVMEDLGKENAASEIEKADLAIMISNLNGKLADATIALANPGSGRDIASLEAERDGIVARIRGGYIAGWDLETSNFTTLLGSGFSGALPWIGSWRVKAGVASQLDASQYFSRLELPIAQTTKPTLYRVTAKSTGKGWVGFGLHLFVSGRKTGRGYGEGKSLLVWFTRDEKARDSKATFLQLYRSDSDVVMERVFDATLEQGLERARKIEIVYDPRREYVAVSLDGTLRAVYKTFFGLDSGISVSLRTLGGGSEFQDFAVLTE